VASRSDLQSKKPVKKRKHYTHWDVDLEKIFAILSKGRMRRGEMKEFAKDCKVERRTLDARKTKINIDGLFRVAKSNIWPITFVPIPSPRTRSSHHPW
jgi:hypothetical protein